jgi:DNA invertase Pin-like site-specific DNA recombinase
VTRYGYARVSTGDQHPEAQEDRLRAAGCVTVFTDRGVSGIMARRPEWDRCLAALEPGDTLVTVRLDRIGRSVGNLVQVVAGLRDRQVTLVVLDQHIDTSTPTGKLLFHFLAAIAEFERDLIIERTRDGQLAVRRRGNLRRSLGGLPPLGFGEGEPGADDWQLDPEAAGWLREAAARVLDGQSVGAVHAALDPITDAAGRKVSPKALRAALQRPASAGLIVIDGELTGQAAIGAPLDEPTFNRLAVLFGSRRRGRPQTGRYPLGPALRCGKCGNQLTGELVRDRRTGQVRGYYACRNPHKALGVNKPCRGCSVPASQVHALVREFMTEWAATPAAQAAAAGTCDTGRRAQVETRIAEAQDWLADLMTKRTRRQITPARYAALEAEITAQIDADAAALAGLDDEPEPGHPVTGWDEMTGAGQLRALAQAVVTPVTVAPGNGGARALTAADRITLIPRQPVEQVLGYEAARRA